MDRPLLRLTILAAVAGLAAASAACGIAQPAAAPATHSHPGGRHQATTTTTPPTSSAPASTTTASTPPPAPTTAAPGAATAPAAGVNTADPNAVATAMLTANFTVDTTVDQSPFDATKRALVWYTPAATNQVLASAPTGSPGAQWITWTQHHVSTTVTVSAPQGGGPPDQPTLVHRAYIVTQTPTGTGGWTGPPNQYICYVILARNGTGPWQVTNLQADPYGNASTPGG